ncbi:nuclear transport factor 2 family protein [Tomitella biformata]|uniref:nuclear transport factor 2 family protein n=1 Tax=Tomitella biformata TaxID=630403 RepID=UPI0004644141|nr:nuclear transport factor 2 family protein [Tomitella biformata]
MTDIEARFSALETRLRLLEDHNEIQALMYSYGPAVDSGSAPEVAARWTEDGVYDVDTGAMNSRAEIHAMVLSDAHQGYIHNGCGHVMSPAYIVVDGDTAVGTTHTQLIFQRKDGKGYNISRVTANRWEFVRTAEGWRVQVRKSRVLDGGEEGRGVFAAGVRT